VFPTSFGPAVDDTHDATNTDADEPPEGDVSQRKIKNADTVRPVYTVPANSTLTGAVAMTALIGRIPVDGTIDDAYPFKVLIGADNLTANGIELPDVAGAVASGTASGDWTWSCVRGQIRSITFVFYDGTIRTVTSTTAGNANAGGNMHGGLGWISDPHGIPCVSGVQRSNAQQYLTSRSLITGAGAASLIDSDNGSEFINHHLFTFCTEREITFTRSRPGNKNDGAHVEQKNWTVVRQTVGYHRYAGQAQVDVLNGIYDLLRLQTNFFLPQQKLLSKTRLGAKVIKKHDKAQTPYQRALTHPEVDITDKAGLTEQYSTLNPAQVQRDILALSHALGRLVTATDLPSHIHPTTAQLLLAGISR